MGTIRHAAFVLATSAAMLVPDALADGVRFTISSGGRSGVFITTGGSCAPRYSPPRHHGGGSWTYRSDRYERRHYESYESRLCRAWEMLADECWYDAQCLFYDLSCERAYDPSPRFGLALAYAMRQDDESALRAMRGAFEVARAGFCLPDIRGLDDVVECAAERYDDIADRRRNDPDVYFMLAATEYLDGRTFQARRAIEDAIELGDCSRAAENLACLVDARVRRSYSRR